MRLFKITILILFTICFVPTGHTVFAETTPKATKGLIDLSNISFKNNKIIALDGEWEIYWNKLLSPKDLQNDAIKKDYYKVPKVWNRKKLKTHYYATYKLNMKLNEPINNLGLKLNWIHGAYRVWINGKLILTHGIISTNKETIKIKSSFKLLNLGQLLENENEIVIQIASNCHYGGGFVKSANLGNVDALGKQEILINQRDMAIAIIILFVGLYNIIIFAFNKDKSISIYFILQCIIMFGFTIGTQNRIITTWFPSINHEIISFLANLPIDLGIITIILYINKLFPKEKIKHFDFLFVLLFVSFFSRIFIHDLYYHFLFEPIMVADIILGAVIVWTVIKAVRNKRDSSMLLLIGISILLLCGIQTSIVGIFELKYIRLMPYGMLALIITQSIIISKRFSLAFKKVKSLSENQKNLNLNLEKLVQERTKELLQAKDEAELANIYKSKFLAHMTHDLRTPLHVVIGILDMFSRSKEIMNNKKLKGPLDIALQSGEQQLKLVNCILDIGRIESGKVDINIESFKLSEIFSGLKEQTEELLRGKPIKFIIENNLPEKNPIIKTDKLKIKQTIMNLLGNAAKFTKQGEIKLAVSLSRPQTGEGLRSRGEGSLMLDTLLFSVSDTGLGISPDGQKYIFESYCQIYNPSQYNPEGSGLGLNICKGFVEALDGKIWVESELDQGSTFKFTVPLHNGNAIEENKNTEETEIDYNFLHDKKILLVDDDNFNCMFAEMILKGKTNYKIFTNGQDVIEALKKEKYDILLTDYNMPEINGEDLLKEIRRFNETMPIAVLTASATKSVSETFIEKGFTDYLIKPFKENELLLFIQKQLKKSHHLTILSK
ncbi:response regulator [Candidatus Margulisiibacteriota bacterium]